MEITALPVYDVRLIRDKLTNTSRGFCFVELGSVEVNIKLSQNIILIRTPEISQYYKGHRKSYFQNHTKTLICFDLPGSKSITRDHQQHAFYY